MPSINWADAAIVASIISGASSIVAAVVASIAGVIIGKRFINQAALQKRLDEAIGDIAFLLGVEQIHCEERQETGEGSQKNRVRAEARERGLEWSAKFTPGRVRSAQGD